MSPQATRILVVDDEPQILRFLTPALRAAGYEPHEASNGAQALQVVENGPVDAIILDLGLPDLDGKEVIARLREAYDVPIIVLSAREGEEERIAALDIGADDFVAKPVGMGELLARLRAALRKRPLAQASASKVVCGELELDFAARRVTLYGDEVKLSPKEYSLLRTLAARPGSVVTHRQVIDAVWGPGAEIDAQFVRVLVGQLRSKLEADTARPEYVLTEPRIGYRLGAGG